MHDDTANTTTALCDELKQLERDLAGPAPTMAHLERYAQVCEGLSRSLSYPTSCRYADKAVTARRRLSDLRRDTHRIYNQWMRQGEALMESDPQSATECFRTAQSLRPEAALPGIYLGIMGAHAPA